MQTEKKWFVYLHRKRVVTEFLPIVIKASTAKEAEKTAEELYARHKFDCGDWEYDAVRDKYCFAKTDYEADGCMRAFGEKGYR